MKCPRCQHENEASAKFCEECAAPLARGCSNCGRHLSLTANFCPECAHPTGVGPATRAAQRFGSPESYTPKHLAEKILTSKSALEGERKQVTPRPALARPRAGCRRPPGGRIDARARDPKHRANHRERIAPARARTHPAHRRVHRALQRRVAHRAARVSDAGAGACRGPTKGGVSVTGPVHTDSDRTVGVGDGRDPLLYRGGRLGVVLRRDRSPSR